MDKTDKNKNYNKIEYCLGSGFLTLPCIYISNHTLTLSFSFVKGYRIAESLYFLKLF